MLRFSGIIIFFTCLCGGESFAQSPLEPMKWLLGEWKGEGTGQPGQGEGGFTLETSLDGKVLVRKNRSSYPAKDNKPAFVHDDIMIVFPEANQLKSMYWDNEGHLIRYSVAASESKIVLLSDPVPNAPQFRLTYDKLDERTVNVLFDMSRDGEKFVNYTTGKCRKVR